MRGCDARPGSLLSCRGAVVAAGTFVLLFFFFVEAPPVLCSFYSKRGKQREGCGQYLARVLQRETNDTPLASLKGKPPWFVKRNQFKDPAPWPSFFSFQGTTGRPLGPPFSQGRPPVFDGKLRRIPRPGPWAGSNSPCPGGRHPCAAPHCPTWRCPCRTCAAPPGGYGSKLSQTAGFGPCFHLPGFHRGYLFLTHSQLRKIIKKIMCEWVVSLLRGNQQP